MQTQQHTEQLGDYVAIDELLPKVQSTFATLGAIRWAIRQHRQAFVDGGALIAVGGQLRFHPKRFEEVAIAIGRRAALQGAPK